jgi:hypothetical protein
MKGAMGKKSLAKGELLADKKNVTAADSKEDKSNGVSDLLSPELRAQLGLPAGDASDGEEGPGLDIIYTSSKKKKSTNVSSVSGSKKRSIMDSDSESDAEPTKPLSKNQQRKLDQLAVSRICRSL